MPGGLNLRKLSAQKKRSAGDLQTISRTSSSHLLNDVTSGPQTLQIGSQVDSPIANVSKLLAENADEPPLPPLFCELLELKSNRNDEDPLDEEWGSSWKQTGRWLRYEQTVEGSGTRFSKPVLSILKMTPLLQVRNLLKRGLVLLDHELEKKTIGGFFESVISAWSECGMLREERAEFVKTFLSAPKVHLVNGRMRTANEILHSIDHHRKGHESPNNSSDEGPNADDADAHLLKKLPLGTESAVVLVGSGIGGLDRPLSAFIRLQESHLFYPEVPDHAVPVRFLFVFLNPESEAETLQIGRTMCSLLSDEVFHIVAAKATDRFTLADAVDETLGQVLLLPPGQCSENTRLHPKDVQVDADSAIKRRRGAKAKETEGEMPSDEHKVGIAVSGRLFGGLAQDVRTKLPFFVSDFTDFFRGRFSQSFAATASLFFANLTNIITFAAVMEKMFEGQMGAIENILCCAISGVIFGLFSGQPLNVLSATGPTLIFEGIIYGLCKTQGWEFLPFRFWMGCWVAFFLLMVVARDWSALVAFITRFTEEAFSTLIAVVFIIQAVERVWHIQAEAPMTRDPLSLLREPYCRCEYTNGHSKLLDPDRLAAELAECAAVGGGTSGEACSFKPEIFLFSVLVAAGTFALAIFLKDFKQSRFFTSKVRNFVSDFGVLISIVVFTGVSLFVGLQVPGLQIPDSLSPTFDRSWIVDLTNVPSIYIALLAAIPALFYTILIVMDQQITAVIVNRADNRLQKGLGYHLDLLVVAVLVLICSLFGLPFYVAATVLSVAHVDSLKIQSDASTPGQEVRLLGVKEQRLTVIISHLLIGLSLFFTRVVRLVPLPVLLGVFLFLGVVSLAGLQFIQRLLLLLQPVKNQPEYKWLRPVRMKRVHFFTFIQLASILALFALKSIGPFKMLFPLMLVLMVLIRALPIERWFSQTELIALDDRLPSWSEVMRPPKQVEGRLDDPALSALTTSKEEEE